MYKVWMCTLIVLVSAVISAQDIDVAKRLSNNFKSYNQATVDLNDLSSKARSSGPNVNLNIPESKGNGFYELELFKTTVVSDDYVLTVYDGISAVTTSGIDLVVMDGYISDRPASRAFLVVGPEYFFAYIDDGRDQYYYEPLSFYGGDSQSGDIVIYKDRDVKPTASTCGSKAFHQHNEARRDKSTTRLGECFIVDYAVASDFEMYKDFNNSVAQVEAFVISITGLMNGDYDTSFDDELRHTIVQNVVSTSTEGDDWLQGGSPSTIDELLNEFTAWGPGNLVSHDVASLWTGYDLSGNTVGLAWIGVVCSSFRYNVLEHFTSNTNSLRVLTSHELGHNYDAGHDSGNGFIMSPSVNNTTEWSTESVNTINAYYTPRAPSCFESCGGGGGGPDANFSFNITNSCAPGQVEFTDISTGNPTSWSWTFQGGVPSTSSERNPVVNYSQIGSFDVTLTVTNSQGSDNITRSNIIVIYDQPVADFSFQVSGQEVFFNNNSINATNYLWDFGNGQTSTLSNPVIDYGENGSFTVSLTASNDCGSDEFSQVVVTGGPPIVNLTYSATDVCVGESITFTDVSTGNPTSRLWEFDGGAPSTSTSETQVVQYFSPGQFDVSLTVSNASGTNSAFLNNLITVTGSPTADFTFEVIGNEVLFDNASINGTGYVWDFGDGQSSTISNPVINYNEPGSYNVTLTTSNDCGSDEITKVVVIGGPPIVNLTYSATDVCVGESITFTDISTGNPTSRLWEFDGGAPSTSTSETQVVQYFSPGQFDVSITVSNASGTNSAFLNNLITVTGSPTADFTFEVIGNEVLFDNASINGTGYVWDFGNGQSSTISNPVINYNEPGSYNVTLTTSNDCGSDEITKIVFIEGPPIVNFTYSATDVCVGESITFTDVSTGNPTSRLWEFDGGAPSTSASETQVVQYFSPGQFDVNLTVSNATGEDSRFLNDLITVTSTPTAEFNFEVNVYEVTFENMSVNATDFTWNFGNGESSSLSDPVISFSEPGSYNVSLTAANDCGDDEIVKMIIIIGLPEASFTSSETNICTGQSVTYIDNSTGNPTDWLWTFEGGTPESSTFENPTVQYLLPGQYDVTLSVTNENGIDVAESIDYINVIESVEADFNYSVNGGEITFQNQSTSATVYTWDFDDGTSSSMVDPVHEFQEAGTYTITLTAENECSMDVKSMDITIVFLPIAGIEIDGSGRICQGAEVQFLETSSDNVESFYWEFEGGVPATSTDPNPIVQYNDAGTFDVSLMVTNSEGSDIKLIPDAVEVSSTTEAGFTYLMNGGDIMFQNMSVSASEFAWDFGDGNVSDLVEPTHSYIEDGTFIITLEVSGSCGTDEISESIEVLLPPSAAFEINEDEVCVGEVVTITNLSQGGNVTYKWSSEGALISDQFSESPTFIYEDPGTYSVSLIVSNSSGTDTFSINDVIRVFGNVQSDINYSNNSLQVSFINNSSEGIHSWDFGDGNESEATAPIHTYAEENIYEVFHSVTNACGMDSSTMEVNLYTIPEAEFTVNKSSGCAPLEVQINNESSDNTVSYSWLSEGADISSSVDSDPVFTYNQAGVYDLILVATNPAGSDTMTMIGMITVTDTVSADFSYSKDLLSVFFTASTSEGDSYNWNFGDGTNGSGTTVEHTYASEGSYIVVLQVENGCGSTTYSQTLVVNTLPLAGFSAEQNETCAEGSIQFNEEASSNTMSFQWVFEGGVPSTSSDPDPEVSYTNPGNYDVHLIVTGVEGSDTLIKNDFIHIGGPPELESEVTLDGNIIIIENLTEDVISSSFVLGNDTIIGNLIEYAASKNGMVSITLMSENECGNSYEIINTEIDVFPTAMIEMDAFEICAGEALEFPERDVRDGDLYQWTISNEDTVIIADGVNPEVSLIDEGAYNLKLLVMNEYGMDSIQIVDFIKVVEVVDAVFEYKVEGDKITAHATFEGEYLKKWDMGDGTNLEGMSIEYTYAEDGVYNVVFRAENQCGVDTSMITIEVLKSSIFEEITDFIKIYPNPASDFVTIEYAGNQAISIDLLNINGYKLDNYSMNADQSKVVLSISDLPAATYLVRINGVKQVFFRKLVVVK